MLTFIENHPVLFMFLMITLVMIIPSKYDPAIRIKEYAMRKQGERGGGPIG